MSYIQVKNLVKSYGDTEVLHNLSLEMKEGTLTTLLGPSGSGKSTLLRAMAGLEDIDSGQIIINGKDVTHEEPRNRNIGMVFQHYALFPNMTVLKNVMFGLEMTGEDKKVAEEKARKMIKIVGLEGKDEEYPANLSGGQQQRVALARSLVTEPDVLFLDEPLSALDAMIRIELRQQIKEIQHELGITVVLVTHDQEEAMTMSEKIFVLNWGNIEQEGSPSEIYRNPKNEFVADFVGSHNLYNSDQIFTMTGETAPAGELFAIRPETLTGLVPEVEYYTVHAKVRRTSMLGSVLRFWLDVNGEDVVMDQLNRSIYFREDGAEFDLYLPKEDLIIVQ